MKGLSILWAALLFLSHEGASQVEVHFNPGYGAYQMEALKNLQEDYVESFDLPLRVMDSYPAFYNYQVQVAIPDGYGKWGPIVGMATTGSRVSYGDYSGTLIRDEWLKTRQVGLFYEINAWEIKPFSLDVSLQAMVNFSSYKAIAKIDLTDADDPLEQVLEGNARGYGIQPNLVFHYRHEPFLVGVQAGYHYGEGGIIYADKKRDQPIQSFYTNEKLRPSWNGWRAGLSLGLLIGQHRN
jgi:hypothetical protein